MAANDENTEVTTVALAVGSFAFAVEDVGRSVVERAKLPVWVRVDRHRC